MNLRILDKSGTPIGKAELPAIPAKGDLVLVPVVTPDAPTVAMDSAELIPSQPFKVFQVIWDAMSDRVTLVVERAEVPERLLTIVKSGGR